MLDHSQSNGKHIGSFDSLWITNTYLNFDFMVLGHNLKKKHTDIHELRWL